MDKILIFDIETAPDLGAVAALPEPKAPGNLKDPEKIAAAIAEKKAEQLANAALDPDTARITAIGMVLVDVYPAKGDKDPEPQAWLASEAGLTEYDLLEQFWEGYKLAGGRVCGYNIIGFDLPMILRRSFALGVKPDLARPLQMAKYRTEPILDLMGVLYNWDRSRGLKWVCKRYGIPNPLPELNGSMVGEMDRATLRKYVANDVSLTLQLYRWMQGVYF
jgi:hypothetical protein